MFEDEIGGVRIIIESQLGVRIISSAPSFRAQGGHIFDVVAQGLKKHVFTTMLAQHVTRNYACICGPQGLELTATHPVD